MTGGGGDASPPVDGGEFLLQLLKHPTHHPHPHLPPPQSPAHYQPLPPPPTTTTQILTHDPAVAALGPSVRVPFFPSKALSPSPWPHHTHHHQSPPPYAPRSFFLHNHNPRQNPTQNPSPVFLSASPPGFSQGNFQQHNSFGEDVRKLGFLGNNSSSSSSSAHQLDTNDLIFGSLRRTEVLINGNFSENRLVSSQEEDKDRLGRREMGLGNMGRLNSYEVEFQHPDQAPRVNSSGLKGHHGHGRGDNNGGRGTGYWDRHGKNSSNYRVAVPPPGFIGQKMDGENREYANRKMGFENVGVKDRNNFRDSRYRSGNDAMERRNDGDCFDDRGLSCQLYRPGPPPGSTLHSVSASDIEESMMAFHSEDGGSGKEFGNGMRERMEGEGLKGQNDLDDLVEQLGDSLGLKDETDEKNDKKKHHRSRDEDYRSDKRGQWLLGQRMRYMKRQVACRGDIDSLNAPMLAIYESLIPAEEEMAKQKQLLALLEKIVCKEWPEARLYLYGSCANSFGFSKSDIDVCLTIADADTNKSEVLLKLADLLQLENLQNVQALTRARVPIVKLMDPVTGISGDICINNVLAVVNTKLLRDYACIDVRLRQLAFIVKHWAKSRGVNETYQGTLSSYAYVLMCIHFLQQRRPAILPCLQGMKTTYCVNVDNIECAYFDQVENLFGFGSHNGESIAQLIWGFFSYWAYCHDYANDVISVRTGTILSKRTKDWTRRIGNDRHLICIEDPFELSHDLGRVVDKYSIRVLREEFERAAEIMQYDPNPCVKLFEPYVPT
ncbi:hypothetical protein ACH5RR_000274 [Cinchona calisaya]|uniref:RNA uridylyltransferase n=1 Tax=Cinchona calisaya TaxID=153742 RepID=A0ABD3B0M4_9GENT